MSVDFKLYLITDRKQTKMPLPDAVRLALQGGVRAIQLREKDLPIRELLALALELRTLTQEFGAKLFINDRVDVAILVNADGVHLGHLSMPVEAVRELVPQNMLLGVSTHTMREAGDAQKGGADFITFGPVFPTPSKAEYGAPAGTEALREVVRELDIPVFGLGGITGRTLRPALGTGAAGVAMISEIFCADDVQASARKIVDAMGLIDKFICSCCLPR